MRRDRAYRLHQTERVIKTRKRLVKLVHPSGPTGLACVRHEHQLGIRKPYDCGKTDCPLCCKKGVKGARRETLQEREVPCAD